MFHISWHVFLLGFFCTQLGFCIAHAPIEESGKQHLKILKLNLNGESNYLPKTFAGEYAHPNHYFSRGPIMYSDYFVVSLLIPTVSCLGQMLS